MRIRPLYLAAALFFLPASTAFAQTSPAAPTAEDPAISYFFVSPNTDANLTLDQAIERVRRPDERALVKEARQLAQCLGIPARIQPGVGN